MLWIDGSSIQVAPTAELQKISNKLRKNLNLPAETLDNEETRQNDLNDQNNHVKWDDPQAFTTYRIYEQNADKPAGGSNSGYGENKDTNSGSSTTSSSMSSSSDSLGSSSSSSSKTWKFHW